MLGFFISSVLGAFFYRLRGADLGIGTQANRLIWCGFIVLLVGALTNSWLAALASAVGAFVGLMIPHGDYHDMGRGRHPGYWSDAVMLLVIGLARGILILVPSMLVTGAYSLLIPFGAVAFGVSHAIAYMIGWELDRFLIKRGVHATETGEALAGLLWGATIYLALQ